jgi:hypothetical protein
LSGTIKASIWLKSLGHSFTRFLTQTSIFQEKLPLKHQAISAFEAVKMKT